MPHYSPDPIIVSFPVIIKAAQHADGRRTLEVEASNPSVDAEGDVIEQSALLNSAKNFLDSGFIDIDHIGEIGTRLGIPNPESYIIGKPLEVNDLGSGRTGVIAEIFRSPDGIIDIVKNRYDSVWESIRTGVRWKASVFGYPEENGVDDCRGKVCASGARRFHIKAMLWKSLALTRSPVNTEITGYAKIITAKSYIAAFMAAAKTHAALQKDNGASNIYPWQVYMAQTMMPPRIPAQSNTSNTRADNRPAGMGVVPSMGAITAPTVATAQSGAPGLPASTGEHEPVYPQETFMTESGIDPQQPQGANPQGNVVQSFAPNSSPGFSANIACALPRDLSDAVGQYHTHMKDSCPHCEGTRSTIGFKNHFANCCGMPEEMADLFAHALMHKILLSGRRVG